VASRGTCRRHFVRVHVVVFAVRSERHGSHYRDSSLLPQGLDPARFRETNFSYKSQVTVANKLLPRAERHTIAAAETDGRHSRSLNSGNHLLVHHAGQHHERHIPSLGISHTEPVYKFALLSQFL